MDIFAIRPRTWFLAMLVAAVVKAIVLTLGAITLGLMFTGDPAMFWMLVMVGVLEATVGLAALVMLVVCPIMGILAIVDRRNGLFSRPRPHLFTVRKGRQVSLTGRRIVTLGVFLVTFAFMWHPGPLGRSLTEFALQNLSSAAYQWIVVVPGLLFLVCLFGGLGSIAWGFYRHSVPRGD